MKKTKAHRKITTFINHLDFTCATIGIKNKIDLDNATYFRKKMHIAL